MSEATDSRFHPDAADADDECTFCRGAIRYDGRRWRHITGPGVAGLAACVNGTTEATPGDAPQ